LKHNLDFDQWRLLHYSPKGEQKVSISRQAMLAVSTDKR